MSDHIEFPLLFLGLCLQAAQIGHVTHRDHQFFYVAGFTDDRVPIELHNLPATIGHGLGKLLDQAMAVKVEHHRVFVKNRVQGCRYLRYSIAAEVGIAKH